jgi:hypothetical protein
MPSLLIFLQHSPLSKQQEADSELGDENCELPRKKQQLVASTAVEMSTLSTRKSKGKGKR